MRVSVQFAILLASIVLPACTPRLQDEIDRNEGRWIAQSISSYRVEVIQVRSIWHAQTYFVTVANGKVSEATSTCVPAPVEGARCEVEAFVPEDFTIPGLFAIARTQAQVSGAEYVTVRFNEQFGYPEEIRFDDPNAVDDDISWGVRRFEPQP